MSTSDVSGSGNLYTSGIPGADKQKAPQQQFGAKVDLNPNDTFKKAAEKGKKQSTGTIVAEAATASAAVLGIGAALASRKGGGEIAKTAENAVSHHGSESHVKNPSPEHSDSRSDLSESNGHNSQKSVASSHATAPSQAAPSYHERLEEDPVQIALKTEKPELRKQISEQNRAASVKTLPDGSEATPYASKSDGADLAEPEFQTPLRPNNSRPTGVEKGKPLSEFNLSDSKITQLKSNSGTWQRYGSSNEAEREHLLLHRNEGVLRDDAFYSLHLPTGIISKKLSDGRLETIDQTEINNLLHHSKFNADPGKTVTVNTVLDGSRVLLKSGTTNEPLDNIHILNARESHTKGANSLRTSKLKKIGQTNTTVHYIDKNTNTLKSVKFEGVKLDEVQNALPNSGVRLDAKLTEGKVNPSWVNGAKPVSSNLDQLFSNELNFSKADLLKSYDPGFRYGQELQGVRSRNLVEEEQKLAHLQNPSNDDYFKQLPNQTDISIGGGMKADGSLDQPKQVKAFLEQNNLLGSACTSSKDISQQVVLHNGQLHHIDVPNNVVSKVNMETGELTSLDETATRNLLENTHFGANDLGEHSLTEAKDMLAQHSGLNGTSGGALSEGMIRSAKPVNNGDMDLTFYADGELHKLRINKTAEESPPHYETDRTETVYTPVEFQALSNAGLIDAASLPRAGAQKYTYTQRIGQSAASTANKADLKALLGKGYQEDYDNLSLTNLKKSVNNSQVTGIQTREARANATADRDALIQKLNDPLKQADLLKALPEQSSIPVKQNDHAAIQDFIVRNKLAGSALPVKGGPIIHQYTVHNDKLYRINTADNTVSLAGRSGHFSLVGPDDTKAVLNNTTFDAKDLNQGQAMTLDEAKGRFMNAQGEPLEGVRFHSAELDNGNMRMTYHAPSSDGTSPFYQVTANNANLDDLKNAKILPQNAQLTNNKWVETENPGLKFKTDAKTKHTEMLGEEYSNFSFEDLIERQNNFSRANKTPGELQAAQAQATKAQNYIRNNKGDLSLPQQSIIPASIASGKNGINSSEITKYMQSNRIKVADVNGEKAVLHDGNLYVVNIPKNSVEKFNNGKRVQVGENEAKGVLQNNPFAAKDLNEGQAITFDKAKGYFLDSQGNRREGVDIRSVKLNDDNTGTITYYAENRGLNQIKLDDLSWESRVNSEEWAAMLPKHVLDPNIVSDTNRIWVNTKAPNSIKSNSTKLDAHDQQMTLKELKDYHSEPRARDRAQAMGLSERETLKYIANSDEKIKFAQNPANQLNLPKSPQAINIEGNSAFVSGNFMSAADAQKMTKALEAQRIPNKAATVNGNPTIQAFQDQGQLYRVNVAENGVSKFDSKTGNFIQLEDTESRNILHKTQLSAEHLETYDTLNDVRNRFWDGKNRREGIDIRSFVKEHTNNTATIQYYAANTNKLYELKVNEASGKPSKFLPASYNKSDVVHDTQQSSWVNLNKPSFKLNDDDYSMTLDELKSFYGKTAVEKRGDLANKSKSQIAADVKEAENKLRYITNNPEELAKLQAHSKAINIPFDSDKSIDTINRTDVKNVSEALANQVDSKKAAFLNGDHLHQVALNNNKLYYHDVANNLYYKFDTNGDRTLLNKEEVSKLLPNMKLGVQSSARVSSVHEAMDYLGERKGLLYRYEPSKDLNIRSVVNSASGGSTLTVYRKSTGSLEEITVDKASLQDLKNSGIISQKFSQEVTTPRGTTWINSEVPLSAIKLSPEESEMNFEQLTQKYQEQIRQTVVQARRNNLKQSEINQLIRADEEKLALIRNYKSEIGSQLPYWGTSAPLRPLRRQVGNIIRGQA